MITLGSTPIASNYYQVKVGGDAAALKGVMKAVVESGGHGRGYWIATSSPNIPTASMYLRPICARQRGRTSRRRAGSRELILTRVADAYIKSNATIVSYGMGITQHAKGTQNVQQIASLLMLRGNIGSLSGICPLRGHSNVQGDRTVGITEKPNPVMFANIEKAFGFRPPPHHGHDAVNAMKAMVDGRAKVLVCLGGNFSIALPDPELATRACETWTSRSISTPN